MTLMPYRPLALCCCLLAFAAPARADNSPACRLLDADDLRAVRFIPGGEPQGNSMDIPAEQVGAPANLHVDICFFYAGAQASRRTLSITIERFASETGVAQWLESKNAQASSEGATLTRLGAATCERGHYAVDKPAPSGASAAPEQHYLACDQLFGAQRLSLSMEMPDSAAGLPSAEALKGLLDRLSTRLPAPAK